METNGHYIGGERTAWTLSNSPEIKLAQGSSADLKTDQSLPEAQSFRSALA